jgi:hypothetical protein
MGLSIEQLDYTVCETSDSTSNASRQGDDAVSQSAQTAYQIIIKPVQEDGVTPVLPSDVPTELVRNFPELPQVNGDTYYYGGIANAYLICSGKSIARDSANRLKFIATVSWESQQTNSTEKGGEGGTPPTNLTDITPTVSAKITPQQIPMWVDKDGKQCWRLPGTGTPFSTPVVETIPVLTLTITQYEASMDYQTMMDRSYKLNSDTYRNKGATSWMTGAVNATEVKVQLASGPVTVAKCTYTLLLSEATFDPVIPDEPLGAQLGVPWFYGHQQTKPLVDDHAMLPVPNSTDVRLGPIYKWNAANKAITDDITTGYIYSGSDGSNAGAQRVPVGENTPYEPPFGATNRGTDKPSYLFFRSQDQIPFTFLQA